jgi:anaerobic selenocysteine-containing dehydrogenase
MSDESERREFLKGAGVAALGGMAVAAFAGTEQAAAAENMAMGRRMVVYARPNVTLEELFSAARVGFGKTGCTTCGLLGGFNVVFMVGDPPEVISANSKGVSGVTLTAAMD